jgi:hypothetical protein
MSNSVINLARLAIVKPISRPTNIVEDFNGSREVIQVSAGG